MEQKFLDDWLDNHLRSSREIPILKNNGEDAVQKNGKGKVSSSPLFPTFLDKWMRGLTNYLTTTPTPLQTEASDSPSLRKSYKREVRSVFGWTDVSEATEPEIVFEKEVATTQPVIQTYNHQDSLPRLPVPKLKETCDKYLKTVEPLLTPDEFATTKQCVEDFLTSGVGDRLQELLLQRDKTEVPSWLEEWWDDAYLYDRGSSAVNVNYFFALEDDPVPEKNHQIGRAASLLLGAMEFKKLLDKETLEPDMERDKFLDMSQHPRLFGATRIPHETRDKIYTYTKYKPRGRDAWSHTAEYIEASPTHVIVIYLNQYYWFDIFRDDNLIPISEVEAYLHQVVQLTHNSKEIEPPVGIFTALERPKWAKIREKLIQLDSSNEETLLKIQQALMIVVLDSSSPTNYDELSRVILHGPVTNRWFDKHQLIVCVNGKAGLNFEHSVGDGSTTLRLADELYKYSVANSRPSGVVTPAVETKRVYPNKLTWKLDDEILEAIEDGYDTFKQAILANETSTLVFKKFGGQFIKDSNISPDAFAQLAIQLAYYKLLGRCDATYESASTKQFLHGRTETVRSVSNESVAFCKAAVQPVMTVEDRQLKMSQLHKLMMNATNGHVKYMREAKEGRGVDRHLFGLRMLYESVLSKEGVAVPSIFTDPAYRKSSYWQLSTSHCGSSSLSLFGFGPVVSDGFGVGYMIKNNSISFNVTSKNSQPWTSSPIFVCLLEESLLFMQAIAMSLPDKLNGPSKSLNFTHPTNSASFHYLDWKPSVKANSPPPQ